MKTIKLILIIITLTPLLVGAQIVKKHGDLSVNEIYLVDKSGEPLMLKGVSYGWHNWWPRFYNKSTVKWLAEDWNAMVVRAAMGIEPEKGYLEPGERSLRLGKKEK